MPTLDDDSGSDREDELPQVVVLQSGDLSAEEAKKIKEEQDPGKGEASYLQQAACLSCTQSTLAVVKLWPVGHIWTPRSVYLARKAIFKSRV